MRTLFLMPQEVKPEQRKLLWLLGAAFFIGAYDMTLLTLVLPDVQASFAIAEEDLGVLVAIARLGAIPAIILALLADRIGRRRLLVVTLAGLALFSFATACAQSAEQFILCQAIARLFASLEEILAIIYALELLPARHRGWGVGFLSALGGIGSGLAALLYSTVEWVPGGWRALYMFGAVAILYIAWLRRLLPESPMFVRDSGEASSIWQPLRQVFVDHRHSAMVLGVIAAAFWFQIGAALNFMSKFLQQSHGYSPAQVSALFIVAGTVAIFGNVVAGRVSDAIGRRPTLATGIVVNSLAIVAFYNTSGLLLPLTWIAALFSFFVVDVTVGAISGELFPTSCRSTAASFRSLIAIVSGAIGLLVESTLYSHFGSHATALSVMVLSSLLALPAVLLWLRETANTDLG